jgi:ATP/maltotriose-dependent transcriptional regulator MalT
LREGTLDSAGPELFAQAAELARSVAAFDAEMTAISLEGQALVAHGSVVEGLARMDEAAAAACAGELEHPLAITYACCQLLGACSRVRDYERASQWCERIAVLCDRRNIWSVLNVSRCFYAPILVGRGLYAEAERILVLSATEYRDRIPHHGGQALAWLADLRMRQGRVAEALRLLDRAEPDSGCRLTRAALALACGRDDVAAEHAAAFLRQSAADRHVERATALEFLARAQARGGHTADARATLAELSAASEVVATAPVRASLLIAQAAVHEAEGDLHGAREELGDAADLFERGQAPYEAALARIELARVLDTLGRAADAARERARGEQKLHELRASDSGTGPLSKREREVLRLVADGLANPEIAARLMLSTHTVHRHLANIMRKLGASSRAAAVARAGELGLL